MTVEREGLESRVNIGPYANHVIPISGAFTFTAWHKGAVRDSLDGVAEWLTRDGARWRLALDHVQTKAVPHYPRFGGVILGLHFHGNTAVHAPLVPINSGVALRTCGQLYKNRALVTDNALVHVMLLSGTRRDRGFVLACWECSRKKIGELRLRILPGLGESRFDAGRIQLREGGELRSMFAVGDVRSGSVKRAASAVGKGSIAIAAVHQVLHD